MVFVILLKQEQDSKLQKLQDFWTILAAIHFLFKIAINLKILRTTPIVKLFVYKTVKCKVLNVEFLSRDLPLNNSSIMVKLKCLKLLYLSEGMCGIDSQLKKLIRLKYLILETAYSSFSIFSWYFVVLYTLKFLSPIFSVISKNNLSFFGSSNPFCVCFYNLKKKKIFIFKYF